MGLIREPKEVDFEVVGRPLTEEEHKEISKFIRKSKESRQKSLQRRQKGSHNPV